MLWGQEPGLAIYSLAWAPQQSTDLPRLHALCLAQLGSLPPSYFRGAGTVPGSPSLARELLRLVSSWQQEAGSESRPLQLCPS